MSKAGGKGRTGGGDPSDIHIDEDGMAMYTRYAEEKNRPASVRVENKDMAKEFGVPERTFVRKVQTVLTAMEVIRNLDKSAAVKAAAGTPRPRPAEERPKAAPGAAAKGSLAVRGSETYNAIAIPEGNVLEGREDAEIGQIAIAAGSVVGCGAADILSSLTDDRKPMGQRVLQMSRGSMAIGNWLLGAYATFQQLNQLKPMKQVDENGDAVDRR
jgi:hypothetical protein